MGRWSEVRVGERIGPLTFELTADLHRRFLEAAKNDLPVHRDVVDPTVAGNFAIALLGSRYPGPIIHSHQELVFEAKVCMGDVVVGRGAISRREMRRGKAYVAIDCDFERDGRRVWWARMTCVWPEVHLRGEV